MKMRRTETEMGNYVRAYKCSSCGYPSYPFELDFGRYIAKQLEVCPKCGAENAYIPIVGYVKTTMEYRFLCEPRVIDRTFIEKES